MNALPVIADVTRGRLEYISILFARKVNNDQIAEDELYNYDDEPMLFSCEVDFDPYLRFPLIEEDYSSEEEDKELSKEEAESSEENMRS
jgi:hypothetical protein